MKLKNKDNDQDKMMKKKKIKHLQEGCEGHEGPKDRGFVRDTSGRPEGSMSDDPEQYSRIVDVFELRCERMNERGRINEKKYKLRKRKNRMNDKEQRNPTYLKISEDVTISKSERK